MKLVINSVGVHPQLSHNGHPVDSGLVAGIIDRIPMSNCLRFSFVKFIHCLVISSPPPLSFASLTSGFVVDDSLFLFVLGLLCYCWLSFRSCASSLPDFCWLFVFVFLDCVYLCCHLLCTFDEWVHMFDFHLQSFSFVFTHRHGYKKIK